MEKSPSIQLDRVNELFGQRVTLARNKHELSQAELAEKLGARLGKTINTSTINRIEKGTRPTPLIEIYALSEILRTTVDDLMPPQEPLMAASLPLFWAAQESMDNIDRLQRDLQLAKERDSALIRELVAYWDLRGVRDGERRRISEETARESVLTLHRALARETGFDRSFEIAEGMQLSETEQHELFGMTKAEASLEETGTRLADLFVQTYMSNDATS